MYISICVAFGCHIQMHSQTLQEELCVLKSSVISRLRFIVGHTQGKERYCDEREYLSSNSAKVQDDAAIRVSEKTA